MKVKGMLSVRLALLTGLVLISGGAHSAGEPAPDDASQATGALAVGQRHTEDVTEAERAGKGAEDRGVAPVLELNFGKMAGNPAAIRQYAVGADNAGDTKNIVGHPANEDSSDASTSEDSGHGTETGSDAGNGSDIGSHTDSAGGGGHPGDSALTTIDENTLVAAVSDAAVKTDQSTQTDAFDNDKVNINTATAEELSEGLKGIGPKKAQAIVVYRDKHGPFTHIDQLKEVKGIGPATMTRNQDRLEL